MLDGHLNKCKECAKKDAISQRNRNLEAAREYDRVRSKTKRRKNLSAKLRVAYREKNPEKYKAHIIVGNAIRKGDLKKGSCEVCGKSDIVHAHHDDYDKPLDVMWLCPIHHFERHKKTDNR